MVFSTSKFQSLSIRPPTPPKDLEDLDKDTDEVLDFLDDPFGTKQPVTKIIAAKSLLNTPQTSPSSESSIPSSSASRKKRVNFDAQPCTIPDVGLAPHSFTPLHSSPLRPLPQSRVSRPLKSILKPSDAASTPPPADQGAPAHKYKSFAEMLESIVKQLALKKRPSSLDAYHSLLRTMQAYEMIPDTQSLVDKMSLLTQFIRRDMQAVSINGVGLDSQLIGQALKLLMALVRIPSVRSAMDDEFCSFTIDRTIQVAADPNMPKSIVNTHLALLMQQNFRQRIMTNQRVEKILDVLDTIQERVSGLSVMAYRIRVYRKLIQQRPDVMTKHTERWFKHTMKALVSAQKDINQSALDTTISAAKTIGTDRQVIKSVLALLNRQKSDGETFAKVMARELEKMLDSDNAVVVPQIWSAVTALLSGSLQPEVFTALKDWLKVFEKCFSSTNDAVKVHANIAFGFLVYAVKIKEETAPSWSKMILNVPQHQLQRRGQWKKSEREAATSGYFTLLYYSLGPVASSGQLDRYWNEFVADFWTPLVHSSSPVHAFAACRIVSALLDGARKPWDAQRALDLRSQAMMQREELPVLDPKWVRKSLSSILKLVETLLDTTPWTTDDCKDEPAKTMWLHLLQSLNAASSQEVMASTESRDATAHIVNLLRRVWDRHTAQLAIPQQKENIWADKFCFLLETVVQSIGPLQFADKCLTRNGKDEFEVAPTPSRPRQNGLRISPLLYFIDLLVNQSEGKLSDSVCIRALNLIFEPSLNSQNTRMSRLELLRDCCAVIDCSSSVATNVWSWIAALTKACIQEQTSDTNERVTRQLGREYEVLVEILSLGSPHLLKQPQGQEVLICFADTVRREAGEGAVVLAIIERVSECVLGRVAEEDKSSCLSFLSILIRNLPRSVIRRTIEQGRQNLWPSSPHPGRNPDFDPYHHFYDAVNSVGVAVYRDMNGENADRIEDFLATMSTSIRQCPIALLAVYLRKVQETIRVWVEDSEGKLRKKEQPAKDLHAQVVNLWQEVCAAVERLPRKDGQILLHLEPLISAGFLSRRRDILNMSIGSWNATFGKEETLRYPARLEQTLRRLRTIVELSLPSLQIGEQDTDESIQFYDSDDSFTSVERKVQTERVKESPSRIVKSTRSSRTPTASNANGRRASDRRASRVRLRHDDSQIQFEPIVSSPTDPFRQESQVLTERQKEMVERQQTTSNLFANIGSTSSPGQADGTTSVRSPLGIHSDLLTSDDLPTENSRTPLNTLPSLGPMDVFVGSSPTPSARNRAQKAHAEQGSVTTPTASRQIRSHDAEELGSSPPQLEKDLALTAMAHDDDASEDVVGDSFGYGQPKSSISITSNGGSLLDEAVVAETMPAGSLNGPGARDDFSSDVDAVDMLNSNLELELTAQFDADIKAQMYAAASDQSEECPSYEESVVADAASHQIPADATEANIENDTEVNNTQGVRPVHPDGPIAEDGADNISVVKDMFSSQVSNIGTGSLRARTRRRSARNSTPSNLGPSNNTKRQPSTGRRPGRPKKIKSTMAPQTATSTSSDPTPDVDDISDHIDVLPSSTEDVSARKTKSRAHASPDSNVAIPETNYKRGMRRSASSLGQVEAQSEGNGVETTPTHKRPRRSLNRDVSEAKPTAPSELRDTIDPKDSKDAQAKRLSHVRVSPRRSPDVSSARLEAVVPEAANEMAQDLPLVGEQNANVALQPPNDTTTSRETERSQSQQAAPEGNGSTTPSRSFTERVILTPRSIINQLRNLKEALFRSSQLMLGRQEEREIDDALFHIRRKVFAAANKGEQEE